MIIRKRQNEKISLKNAGYLFTSAISITVIVHFLVILKVIPFEMINGGRTLTYNDSVTTSVASIIILILLTIFVLISSSIIKVSQSNTTKIIVKIGSWILVVYFALMCVMQFLGTSFEVFFMSIICIISFLSILRIALEKR